MNLIKTYEGFINKHESNTNIENYLDDLLFNKYQNNNIRKQLTDEHIEIYYTYNILNIYLNNKDEIISIIEKIKFRDPVIIQYNRAIKWFDNYILSYYDDELLAYYIINVDDIQNILIFDINQFSNFIDIIITKKPVIIKYIDDRIKKCLNKEIYNKYSHLFQANNFDLI